MSNILNSHLTSIDNPIPAWKIGKKHNPRLVQAPEKVYTYSIDEELKKKDEFRKNVTYAQSKELYTKKDSFLPKALLILGALTTYFIFKCKE